jgi:release factor glutamine methyltransferase
VNLHTALLQGSKLLEDGGIGVARLTAEVLLCHALHCERPYLYGHPERELQEVEWIHYGRYLHERLKGKPTQYITGHQEFYSREFRVTPAVFIPRPETECVIETALVVNRGARRILDVGTGSGAIAVTMRLETGAHVIATDLSRQALEVASGNAQRLGAPVTFVCCDLVSAVASRSMDLIVSNPPYVPRTDQPGLQREVRDWEPELALFGGKTGLEVYERLAAEAARVLVPQGWLVMELGFQSRDRVAEMLRGWSEVRVQPDLAGIPRVIAARLAG